MATIIAVTNQKGGPGKTTVTMNLAGTLARNGKPFLSLTLIPKVQLCDGLPVLMKKRHSRRLSLAWHRPALKPIVNYKRSTITTTTSLLIVHQP